LNSSNFCLCLFLTLQSYGVKRRLSKKESSFHFVCCDKPLILRQIHETPILFVANPSFFFIFYDKKSFKYTDAFLRLRRCSPPIVLNFSFDFTETPSPHRCHGERSPSQRRALVIATPSLRQLVESKGQVQSIPKCAFENPQKRFTQSPKTFQSRTVRKNVK